MRDVTSDNFGLLIAYLIPGFITLWSLQSLMPGAAIILGIPADGDPTIGGFLYGTLGSTAAGLIISAIRWAIIDQLYHRTGIPPPAWDFRKLQANLGAFDSHVQDHYRYFQFYANSLIAIGIGYCCHLVTTSRLPGQGGIWDVAIIGILVVLVLGSRDSLKKYYDRTGALLARPSKSVRSDQKVDRAKNGLR